MYYDRIKIDRYLNKGNNIIAIEVWHYGTSCFVHADAKSGVIFEIKNNGKVVVEHLTKKGWKILDLGVKKDSDPNDTDLMFHRVGLRVGAEIFEGNYERASIFCGTGMGIHIAASKCPHVHAGVVESSPAAQRAITGNGVNVLAMGAFYVAPQTA